MGRKFNTFVVFIFLLIHVFVSAQSPSDEGIDRTGFEDDAGKILNATEKLKEFAEKNKSSYLGEQWKEFLLKNKGISTLDSFLKKVNIIFFILLAKDYNFSFNILFTLLLWIAFFSSFSEIIILFSTFSRWVAYLSGFVFAVILAHFRVYEFILTSVSKLISFFSGWWGIVAWIVFLILLLIWIIFSEKIVKQFKKIKEKYEEKGRLENLEKRQEAQEETQGAFVKIGEAGYGS